MTKGKIIVIEGACDGIGKSTQYELLKKRLIASKKEVVSHHFPSYNTKQGFGVELYLKGDLGSPNQLSPYFVNSLYAYDRAITWYTSLKKEYEEKKTILLDRYTTSSLIYQSALIEDIEEKKAFIDYVCDFEYNKLQIPKPDKVIFLYADYNLVKGIRLKRKENEGISNDIHESNDEFLQKVYTNALFIADYLGWEKIKCDNGSTLKSIKEIHEMVYDIVEND